MRLITRMAIGVALLLPAPTLAATATVGSSLVSAGTTNLPGCGGTIDCVAFTTNNGSPVAVVPFDGIVTKWRVRAGSNGSPVKLRVLRPGSGGSYTAVSTSGTQMTAGGSTADEYDSNVPVKQGDVLAIDNDSSGLLYAAAPAGFAVSYFKAPMANQPALADGSSGAPTDTYPGYQLAMNATIVENAADLSVGVIESSDPVAVGASLSYLVEVKNSGPQAAEAVTLSDQLPEGVTLKSATPSVGTCGTTKPVSCDLGTLASGATATITIEVTPNTAGSIANATSATSTTPDPNGGNNAQTVTTTVTEQPPTQHTPQISSLTFTPARFRLGSFLPTAAAAAAKKPPIGTTVQYLTADATTVTFRFQRLRKGRKPAGAGSLTRPAAAFGSNSLRFSGRLSATRKLKPGRYRVTAVAKYDAVKSAPLRKTIRVIKP